MVWEQLTGSGKQRWAQLMSTPLGERDFNMNCAIIFTICIFPPSSSALLILAQQNRIRLTLTHTFIDIQCLINCVCVCVC